MTRNEKDIQKLLEILYQDVRAYFRYEAEPARQRKEEQAMRETMRVIKLKMERGDDDDA